MTFHIHIGIDYSGRAAPTSRSSALQVYASIEHQMPRSIPSPSSSGKNLKNWCRKEIAEWLIEQAKQCSRFVAGIDHAFSFPTTYFEQYKIGSWPDFLDDFCQHWPTDNVSVESIRGRQGGPLARTGRKEDLRLTEKWTSSAKSAFHFDIQGSVAKSTHAGIPWLRKIKNEVGEKIHLWPFDGWVVPEGKSVIAEVYPSIFRKRYATDGRNTDQQDAYCVARWLCEMDTRGLLDKYFNPPLTAEERMVADREGWILGIC